MVSEGIVIIGAFVAALFLAAAVIAWTSAKNAMISEKQPVE